MKTVQFLYNNNINKFLSSRIKKQIFQNITNLQYTNIYTIDYIYKMK